MVDIRIAGTANLEQMRAQFKAMQVEVAKLNQELAATSIIPGKVNPTGYANMQRQVARSSETWRNAAASTGLFTTQQLKLNSATEQYTELLKKQKLSLNDLRKNRQVMKDAYREQIALQNMVVRENPIANASGKRLYDVAVPTSVAKELDTVGNKLGWIEAQTMSASRSMVNWGKNTQWAGRQLMVGFTMPVAAFGAATGVLAYQVDKQLTRIQKVYDTTAQAIAGDLKSQMAVEKELDAVREASMATARNAANEYGAAAQDTLGVQAELAATGLQGAALQSATTESMRLATLGELDYQQAASTTIALQTAFKLNTQELTEAFNFMNATENATSLSIQDIAEATPRAASAMSALGVSVEEMTVLLTSMKEAGVDAAEGANALKSATGTILAPSPAADNFIKQISNGQVQVTKLAEESGGNLYEALKLLYMQMEGLSDLQKQQILVKLFGKYQFNRVSAMVTNLGDAFTGTENQASKAMELMAEDSKTLADTAETEMTRFQESISGQFKRAWASAQIELSELGQPFLKVATEVLEMVVKLAKAFNSLPDGAKNLAAILAILTALVGPTIMLIGLAANFAGNLGLLIARVVGLGSTMKILNKEEWATQKAAELARLGFVKQGSAVEILTQQINALTLAAQESRLAVGGLASGPGGTNGAGTRQPTPMGMPLVGFGPGALPPGHKAGNPKAGRFIGPKTKDDFLRSEMGVNPNATKAADKQRLAAAEKTLALRAEEQSIVAATGRIDRQISMNREASEKALTKAREKGESAVSGTSMIMAGMAASTAMMVQPWNDSVSQAGQLLMLITLIVPGVKAIGTMATSVGTRFAGAAKAAKATAAANAGAVTATSRAAGAAKLMGAGFKGAGAAAVALMGPLGIAAASVAAIGFVTYKIWQHEKKVTAEKEKQARAMYDQKNLLQSSLDIQVKAQKRLATPSITDEKGMATSTDLANELKSSDAGKTIVSAYKNADAIERETIMMKRYIDTLQAAGGTAEKAQRNVEALFIAAGDEALEAQVKAQNWRDEMGGLIDGKDMSNLYSKLISSTVGDSTDSIAQQGEKMGKILADSIAAGGKENASTNFDQMFNVIATKWDAAVAEMGEGTKNTFAKFGVESGAQMAEFLTDQRELSTNDFGNKYGVDTAEEFREVQYAISALFSVQGDQVNSLLGTEQAVVQELVSQLGLSKDIVTMTQLRATWEWKLQNATEENSAALYSTKIAGMEAASALNSMLGNAKAITDVERNRVAIQILNARGLQDQGSLAKNLDLLFGRAADKAEDIGDNIRKIPNAVNVAFNFTGAQARDIYQSGMEGVTNDMATMASTRFDNALSNATEAATAAQDNAMSGLENSQDKAMDAFDNRWEKRREAVEKAYDLRIKAIEKTIEAEEKAEKKRQEIFKNEIDRINRLADAANQNIDYNVALNKGDFDEAAKIANDQAAAGYQDALEKAAEKGTGASDARIDRLNKRKDRVSDEKDTVLDALSKREDAEREHLQKMQDMQKKSLQKRNDAEAKALQNSQDAERANLEERLTLFKSYTARNQQDLERWMKVVGLSYDDFGISVKDKGKAWSQYFREELASNVRQAGTQIASDNMWNEMGKQASKDMLGGALDMSWGQFKNWMKTGEFKTGGYKPSAPKERPNDGIGADNPNKPKGPVRHTGGWIGEGGGSRKGVARNLKGMHSSERQVLAQDGEYMVDRANAAKWGPALEAISSGKADSALRAGNRSRSNTGSGIGGSGAMPGFAGIMAAVVGTAIKQGISRSVTQKVDSAKAAANAAASAGGTGSYSGVFGDRNYSLPGVKPWVYEAAQYLGNKFNIGTIGGVGERSNASEHPLGRALDFMVSDDRGTALANEVVSMNGALDAMYVIWRQKINSFDGRGWRAMEDRGSATANHFDHVHVSFDASGDTGDLPKMKSGAPINIGGNMGGGGSGGMHKASIAGKGWRNSHDYGNGLNSPLYAYNNGVVVSSYATTSGGSPGNGIYTAPNGMPYRSFGETMTIRGDDGNTVRYAHMAPGKRYFQAGQRVKGGDLIGLSGNTGNSSGPHTHFEANGSEMAREWFASHGIGLKTGGMLSRQGISNLHDDEVVVDAMRTKKLWKSMDAFNFAMGGIAKNLPNVNARVNPNVSNNVANGGTNHYTTEVNLFGSDLTVDDVTKAVIKAQKKMEDRKPGNRKS